MEVKNKSEPSTRQTASALTTSVNNATVSQQRFRNLTPSAKKFCTVFDKTCANLNFGKNKPVSMTADYRKHRKTASIDAAYRTYHPKSPDAAAKTAHTNNGGTLMIVATTASLVIFVLSVYALQDIYRWYPPLVAQQWFIYDQLLTAFSLLELISGAIATTLILSKRSFRAAVALATICTLFGASAFVVTLIQPLALLWQSLIFYFLPLFMTPLVGTILTVYEEKR